MAKPAISTKRLAISKANAQMVAVVAVASFVAVFCLIASKAVVSQNQYRSRVTASKETANRELESNLEAAHKLRTSYNSFDNRENNVIGGTKTGEGDQDGTNSKIVLDALPSTYDFPALASSVEKILASQNLKVSSIGGVDDQIAQQGTGSNPKPEPVVMAFTFKVEHATYDSVNKLVATFEKSIRPIQIDTLKLSGGANNMTLDVTAHTYYQPGRNVDIKKQVQK